MKKITILAACLMCMVLSACSGESAAKNVEIEMLEVNANAEISDLKVQGMTEAVGIDEATPTFAWKMISEVTGAAQTKYQIVVKESESQKTVWDSGVVESSCSNEVEYGGEELTPCTKYEWTVAVTDTGENTVVSDTATFEMGLMNSSKDAWEGAEWIGADELQLDAASCCVFKITTKVQLEEGSNKASLILGADDFRLNQDTFNNNRMEGENYVRVELDYTNVTQNGGAKIHFYRVGYSKDDDKSTPLVTVEENEQLDAIINAATKYDEHELMLTVSASEITVYMNGEQVAQKISVNDFGGDSNYNTYPNLNSVGFSMEAGEKAVFTDYCIENAGKYGTGVLLGAETQIAYDVFNGMTGVTVEGNKIAVDGGSEGILEYEDPTYAAAPMLRKEFTVADSVKQARLYITAQGIYNFYINGEEIAADEWFNPGFSEYDAITGYNTYDVTEYVAAGENAMGAVLGEGWWTGQMTFEAANSNYFGDQPALMAKLVVEYEDGSSQVFVTDESWKYYNDGPVRYASFFQGERYDATKEAQVEGWSTASFEDGEWKNAASIETRAVFENTEFVTRYDEPVHVIEVKEAQELVGETKENSGSYIYDMGENLSGVPVITIPEEYAKAGETITIRFAEILYPELEEYTAADIDGMLMVENYRAAMVTDFYTMKEGENVFAPDLTFHGYRYVEITGLDEALPVECVQMQVLSSVDATATYESSNELANQLFENVVNSTTSNYLSIPTDCPQRNERMGWTGDAQVFAKSASYVADIYNFMEQWMDSVRADSDETGMSTRYSPAFIEYSADATEIDHVGQNFGITWNCITVTVPYNMYLQTGRTDIIKENIDTIYAYMDTLMSIPFEYKNADGEKVEESRLTGQTGTLADHLARVTTDASLLGNALYISCLEQTAQMAEVLGDDEAAEKYRDAAADAKTAWNEIYIDSKTGKTKKADGTILDTQASYATPLRFGVVSDKNLEKVLENYKNTICDPSGEDNDGNTINPYTITTGFNATGNVLNALSDYGLNDVAYDLFESTEYASWLYPVTQGATSIWERWNSYTTEDGFSGNNAMNSFNHYSFGAVYEWMMAYQVGITADEEHPGYERFILQPTAGGTYTELSGSYESVYGTITSAWTAKEGAMTSYKATVPANTAAVLYLPMEGEIGELKEGVQYVGDEEHNGVETKMFTLVSGTYEFELADGSIVCK